MIFRSVSIVAVCVSLAGCAPASPAPAPAPPERTDSPASVLATLPEDVDLAIVVERGSELRASPWGDAAAKFLGDAGTMRDLTKAWDGLGSQLGWSRNEAFDRLLGGRVVLVSKSVGEGRDRRWALLSDVTVETEQRLKERLLAAPRAIVEGHQILTLENGEYELTTHHRPAITPAKGVKASKGMASDRVTIVLGAMGKGELFDEILGRMSAEAKAAAATGVKSVVPGGLGSLDVVRLAKEAEAQGGEDAPAVLLIGALGDGKSGSAWSDFIMLAGQPVKAEDDKAAGASWRSRLVVRQAARREELLGIEATSDAGFRSLSSGSLLAIVQNAPLPEVIGAWARFTTVGSLLPVPDEAKKAMTPHQAVACRAVEPEGRISCTFAMQSADTGELAKTLDGPIAAWISRVEKQLGVEKPALRDFAGCAPSAARVAPFAEGTDSAVSLLSAKPLVVSWAYPSKAVAAGDDAARPGWWVVNVCQSAQGGGGGVAPAGSSPGELLRADSNALLSDGGAAVGGAGAETARWVWLAAARPAEVERLLPDSIPDLNGMRSALRRLDRLDMRLRITEVGDVQGDLEVRLAVAVLETPRAPVVGPAAPVAK